MKASEIVSELQSLITLSGDREVVFIADAGEFSIGTIGQGRSEHGYVFSFIHEPLVAEMDTVMRLNYETM